MQFHRTARNTAVVSTAVSSHQRSAVQQNWGRLRDMRSERICNSEKTETPWLINTELLVAQLAPSMQRERKEEKMRRKSEQSWDSAVTAAHTYAVPGNGTADCCHDSTAVCVCMCVCCAGASASPRCSRWDIAFQVMRLFVGFQSLATSALNVLAATASFTASQFWAGFELDFSVWNEMHFFNVSNLTDLDLWPHKSNMYYFTVLQVIWVKDCKGEPEKGTDK